jgi:hypothetical protein
MNNDLMKVYQNNSIFRAVANRGMQHNFSYERILEITVQYFATLQESYDYAELKRIMSEPPKSMYLTEDEMYALNSPSCAEMKFSGKSKI